MKRFIRRFRHFFSKRSSGSYVRYLRNAGCKIGTNVKIHGQKGIDVTRPEFVSIGNNVVITSDVKILTHDYAWFVLRNKYLDPRICGAVGRVEIGSNVYIATNVTILPGVKIGDNVIIAAGAVVTRDTPSDCVVAGVPAVTICSLDEYYEKRLTEVEQIYRKYEPDLKNDREFLYYSNAEWDELTNDEKNSLFPITNNDWQK